MRHAVELARKLYWLVYSWMVQYRPVVAVFKLWRFRVKTILLTDAEVNSIIRKRCDAVSRRGIAQFDVAEQVVAVVGDERSRFAEITIRSVRPITAKDVTGDMAKAEGFSGLEGWKLNQAKLYGSPVDAVMYRITFNVERIFVEEEANAG